MKKNILTNGGNFSPQKILSHELNVRVGSVERFNFPLIFNRADAVGTFIDIKNYFFLTLRSMNKIDYRFAT